MKTPTDERKTNGGGHATFPQRSSVLLLLLLFAFCDIE
jgi:hypothetical protein